MWFNRESMPMWFRKLFAEDCNMETMQLDCNVQRSYNKVNGKCINLATGIK